ncbi:hypothetical protein WMF04_27905 [Sorangium sp. So ce260]|uniref:hypothetical protein n=1 Tax=Sorangium sp. So ce260 TaxID=3133291 RepID=UPI003F6408BE
MKESLPPERTVNPPTNAPQQRADAIWNFGAESTAHSEPARGSRLRRQGVVRSLLALTVAVVAHLLHWQVVSWVAGAVGGITLFAALVSPAGLYAGIERGLEKFAGVVGEVVTWLVMVPVFYLVFLPFGLAARRGKKDPLKRFYEREAPSYWSAYRAPGPPDRPF